jgi:hypothetical protein
MIYETSRQLWRIFVIGKLRVSIAIPSNKEPGEQRRVILLAFGGVGEHHVRSRD